MLKQRDVAVSGHFSEEELIRLNSFEVMMPSGDGRCSDRDGPCPPPGVDIPHGGGFIYIDESIVGYRKDARSCEALRVKLLRETKTFADEGITYIVDSSVHNPILMCEQCARKRGLDMKTASEDAALAWRRGRLPLRATPKSSG